MMPQMQMQMPMQAPAFNPMMQPGGGLPNQNQQQQQYDPDYFEYDDELPEGEIGERIILSDDPIPVEIGVVKTIGTRKVGFDVDQDQF